MFVATCAIAAALVGGEIPVMRGTHGCMPNFGGCISATHVTHLKSHGMRACIDHTWCIVHIRMALCGLQAGMRIQNPVDGCTTHARTIWLIQHSQHPQHLKTHQPHHHHTASKERHQCEFDQAQKSCRSLCVCLQSVDKHQVAA